MQHIPFNKPYMTGKELWYVSQAHHSSQLSGDGQFTKKCNKWLEMQLNCPKVLLTHSCTAALEISAILANLKLGDEVIMPSYTFVSTANAFVLQGAVPVFVDIRSDTLNIDEKLVETAITNKTRAIVAVHYAGVACEMNALQEIVKKYNLLLIEDAAQGLMASYQGQPLGSIGDLGCFSFHETKNITCGEGGALAVNCSEFMERAEIIREKGTNRSQFFRGQVDKYTWVDKGSSYLPGEVTAAFLYAQLEEAEKITERRRELWSYYHSLLQNLETKEKIRRPIVPQGCHHNAHMYYILLDSLNTRTSLISFLKKDGINAVFHYIPLHSSPAGRKYGRYVGKMTVTKHVSDTLLRLPLYPDLQKTDIERIVDRIEAFFRDY